MMVIHVTAVQVIEPYTLAITFDNGVHRRVNLRSELYGPIFEPLRDPAYFARAYVDPDSRTVAWPNGADFAPDFLYELVEASDTRSNQNLYNAGRAAPGQAGHIVADKDDES